MATACCGVPNILMSAMYSFRLRSVLSSTVDKMKCPIILHTWYTSARGTMAVPSVATTCTAAMYVVPNIARTRGTTAYRLYWSYCHSSWVGTRQEPHAVVAIGWAEKGQRSFDFQKESDFPEWVSIEYAVVMVLYQMLQSMLKYDTVIQCM